MKILIIVNALTIGGAERQAVTDANMLYERGHNVTVAFNKNGPLNKLLHPAIKRYKIRYKHMMLASLQLLWHLLIHRYHIIHAHMFWAEKISAIPAKLTQHKIVFNEHGLGLWRRWYHILMFKIISQFADKIINSCEATKRVRIERENIRKSKLLTIYNTFMLNMHGNIPDNMQFLNKDSKEYFVIGYVGRFHKVKRLETFIELAEELKSVIKNFKIVLVGDGAQRAKLMQQIRDRRLEPYFYMPGFVIASVELYRIFDVLVLPSVREACSVTLLEAEGAGIPVIAFNVGGNPEIIHDGYTGFIIPERDVKYMAQRIVALYRNPQLRNMMSKYAKHFIKTKFSIEKRVTELEKVYRSITHNARTICK